MSRSRARSATPFTEVWGKPLTMNVSMPIAAVLLDLGFPATAAKAVPLLARTAGLLAHLAEEVEQPLGFTLAAAAEEAVDVRTLRSKHGLGTSSSRSTTSRYRAQLAYLFDRSAFYRDKLAAAGFASAEAAGGLAEIARLPLTEKDELRATCTPDNPIGAHLCAEPSEIVRIYSTSGTTGTPSYIPLTASDLDNWVTGSARSYAASGVTAGQRPFPPTTRGRSSRAQRSRPSTGSASATFRSAPGTPSVC